MNDSLNVLERKLSNLSFDDVNLKKEIFEAFKLYKETKELEPYQAQLVKLQKHIEKEGKRLIIIFEGRDAAGKGSLIGTVSRYLNPKHYRVVALGKPTKEQRYQWYFQRYVEHFPTAGEIILFDRSWYNRSMVEPVFGFCTKEEHDIFMNDVIGFEKSVCNQGIVIIKLYLSVKKTEQAKRFEKRKNDPLRSWKLSEVDLQSQAMWDEFSKMKYKMLLRTSHDDAPWHVIRSSNKHNARIEAIKLILQHFDYEGKDSSISLISNRRLVVSSKKELEMMRKRRADLFINKK